MHPYDALMHKQNSTSANNVTHQSRKYKFFLFCVQFPQFCFNLRFTHNALHKRSQCIYPIYLCEKFTGFVRCIVYIFIIHSINVRLDVTINLWNNWFNVPSSLHVKWKFTIICLIICRPICFTLYHFWSSL